MADKKPTLSEKGTEETFEFTRTYSLATPRKEKVRVLPVPEDTLKEIVSKIELINKQKSRWADIVFDAAMLFLGAIFSNFLSIGSLTSINIWLGFVGFGFAFAILLTIFITSKIIYKKQKRDNLESLQKELEDILNTYKQDGNQNE